MVFVTYYDLRAAERARERLQGSEISGRPIDVHYSLPRDDQKQGGGGGGGGNERDKNQQYQGCLIVTLKDSRQPIDDNEVRRKFQQFGDVKSVTSASNRMDQRYVEYYDMRNCDEAFDRLRHQGLQDGTMDATTCVNTEPRATPTLAAHPANRSPAPQTAHSCISSMHVGRAAQGADSDNAKGKTQGVDKGVERGHEKVRGPGEGATDQTADGVSLATPASSLNEHGVETSTDETTAPRVCRSRGSEIVRRRAAAREHTAKANSTARVRTAKDAAREQNRCTTSSSAQPPDGIVEDPGGRVHPSTPARPPSMPLEGEQTPRALVKWERDSIQSAAQRCHKDRRRKERTSRPQSGHWHPDQATDTSNGPLALQKGRSHPERLLTPWTGHWRADQTTNAPNRPLALQKGHPHPERLLRPLAPRSDHQDFERTTSLPDALNTQHSHSKQATRALRACTSVTQTSHSRAPWSKQLTPSPTYIIALIHTVHVVLDKQFSSLLFQSYTSVIPLEIDLAGQPHMVLLMYGDRPPEKSSDSAGHKRKFDAAMLGTDSERGRPPAPGAT
ncbi:hypothetical protein BU15DRAFT_66373 [Melanogaster broomeanus]|nr:hypothetical protein BU15DRAFT_66373 [Melanogaster broomeanus]